MVRIGIDAFRRLLAEQVDIADVLLRTFSVRREALKEAAGSALELVGWATAAETRALRAYVGRLALPHAWFDASLGDRAGADGRERDRRGRPAGRGRRRRGADQRDTGDRRRGARLHLPQRRPRRRPGRRRWRAGGPRGRGVRRVRGSRHGAARLSGAGRPGRHHLPDRELPGLPGGHQRRRAGPAGDGPGAQVRHPDLRPCSVADLEVTDGGPTLHLVDGTEIRARAIIVASGARYRRLDVPGWDELEAAGCVHYSATELDVRGYESDRSW